MHIPRKRLFWAVALGHLANDSLTSIFPVVLAFISVNIMPVSTAQIGMIVGTSALLGALTQPFFGWLTDRNGGRWLGYGSLIWTSSFVLLGIIAAQQGVFVLMVLGFILPALGSGAFHPVGSKYSAESDPTHAASNMAYFFLMGQLGLALGPAVTGLLLNNAGSINQIFTAALGPVFQGALMAQGTLTPIYVVSLVAIPPILLMIWTLPNRQAHLAKKPAQSQRQASRSTFPITAFIILIVMVTLRSLAQPGTVNFIPVMFQQKGWSPAEYGLITSLFWVGSGVAGVIFGNLADRFDRRWVIALSLAASAPAFFFLPTASGTLALVLALAAGGLSGASHSIIVVLAQGLMPGSKALASGLILGLIFGMGALGNFLIGWMSEAIGLTASFQWVAGAVIVASVLALLLPAAQHSNKQS